MRVLVCGGRDFHDRDFVFSALDTIDSERGPITVIIHGGAKGADYLAFCWALWCDCRHEEFQANWLVEGPAAGPIRNQRMIDDGKPDLVIAFPGGRGTADMVRRARSAGIEVVALSPVRAGGRV